MQTLQTPTAAGFKPEPLTSRVFVRCYRHYAEAKRAYDQLRVVAGIPDTRMTVVARGLEWREPLPLASLVPYGAGSGATIGGIVGLLLWILGFADADTGWLAQTVFGALAGVAAGLLSAVAVAWTRRGRTSGVQTGHVEPRQYDILVEEEFVPVAREVLDVD
jgi:hypothetical protein